MEHIVQFAVGIDDNAIRQRIEQGAEKVIIQQLADDIKKTFYETDYYGRTTGKPSGFILARIESFLEENKDDILEMAADKIADKLARSKRGKEILEKCKE